MNISDQFARSPQSSKAIVEHVEAYPSALDGLLTCFFADDWRINQ